MISIVVPVLNEEKIVGRCLRQFADHREAHEIVVVDGGSRDGTAAVVHRFPGVRFLRAPARGRGLQMNRGARAARGETLLFLHADTILPPQGLRMIAAAMARPGIAAGSFRLAFSRRNRFLDLFAYGSRINHILFTYGDQGLFMARWTFERIGGYAELPIMEDVEIQKRLRKRGRFVKLPAPVTTSARRFLSGGILRQQALNTVLVLLYHTGASPMRIHRFYPPP